MKCTEQEIYRDSRQTVVAWRQGQKEQGTLGMTVNGYRVTLGMIVQSCELSKKNHCIVYLKCVQLYGM